MKRKLEQTGVAGFLFMFILSMLFLVSCDLENERNTPMKGHLRVLITDAPFPLDAVKNAMVSVDKITIHKVDMDDGMEDDMEDNAESENDEDSGNPHVTIFEGLEEINLMDLQNGVTEVIADLEIDAGNYDQIRIYISEASIELNDGSTYDLKVPGASSSGLKIFITPDLVVEGGGSAELLLDFDLSRSLVAKGPMHDIKGFNFKPVIRAVNSLEAGRIEGTVTDTSEAAVAIQNANVWIESEDTVVSSTMSEESGFYALIGVPEGTFTLFASKESYDTLMVENVEVMAGENTILDLELVPSDEGTGEESTEEEGTE